MKRRLRFKSAEFIETAEELINPFRGWYQIYKFCAELEPDYGELIWCLKKEESCALVLIDIGAYKNRELDEVALGNIRRILGFFDEQGKDIILRVAYDTEGKNIEHEPAFLSHVIEHIEQLGPIIQEYRDRIVFFEGMLVGNWGEMHGSRFLTKNNMLKLNAALEKSAAGIFRAVRRPSQWRMLHSEPPAAGTEVGLFNDAIFGSDTDLGTFASFDSEDWEEPWLKERELDFEERLGRFAPQCGEAVCGEEYAANTLETTVERLRRMNLSCLNSVYDDKILGLWKEWAWNAPGVWQGINGYDYIGRHLGYRFCVRDASVRSDAEHCDVSLTVENVGFSVFYQEAEALLILADEAGNRAEYLTDWDIRDIKSGKNQALAWRIPRCEGRLYLLLRRKWDHKTIRFANPSTSEGLVFIGDLKN